VATAEDAAKDVQAFISIVCPDLVLAEVESLLLTRHQFFEAFKEFEGREFHMAGESYGVSRVESCLSLALGCAGFVTPSILMHTCQGRYLPLFASAVVDGNKALIKEKKTPINLQSVLIGNGITDFCGSGPCRALSPSMTNHLRSLDHGVLLPLRECQVSVKAQVTNQH
jgi:cathepsin A (carboxypeptidase C)